MLASLCKNKLLGQRPVKSHCQIRPDPRRIIPSPLLTIFYSTVHHICALCFTCRAKPTCLPSYSYCTYFIGHRGLTRECPICCTLHDTTRASLSSFSQISVTPKVNTFTTFDLSDIAISSHIKIAQVWWACAYSFGREARWPLAGSTSNPLSCAFGDDLLFIGIILKCIVFVYLLFIPSPVGWKHTVSLHQADQLNPITQRKISSKVSKGLMGICEWR